MLNKTISFIGTGKMATALISSIYRNKLNYEITASDHKEENLKNIKSKFSKITTTLNNKEAVKKSDIIFICVKPQVIKEVLNEIKSEIKNQLIVSIAAGIKIKNIEKIIGKKRVIRVMPNVNCLVGEMAAGFAANIQVTKKDIKEISNLLNSAGMSFFIKEEMMDAMGVIGPGTGPAFFSLFIKYLAEAGMKKGLSLEMALKVVAQTALGTGKLILEKNLSPDEIISMVASKKGTTVAGLKILEKNKLKVIIQDTVNAAYKRSKELGK
ncbi:MAG TPA: pyrroline-5-carboxylate reductase [Candidatus Nanoarchaeia archaeon]|nr:pyrroline-5-carboxylate reductase [Candidatus Nanoarchaeia archaeon]